ncbi:MAG TPA: hypothetical protein DHV39_17720 [Verrucomicrobiales bacterium]|nr:hypothetical protein [Verrucomicrobiales bacterium]HCZ05228.1 hypothetical protein [Verrucomicrobiales bacterium]
MNKGCYFNFVCEDKALSQNFQRERWQPRDSSQSVQVEHMVRDLIHFLGQDFAVEVIKPAHW